MKFYLNHQIELFCGKSPTRLLLTNNSLYEKYFNISIEKKTDDYDHIQINNHFLLLFTT